MAESEQEQVRQEVQDGFVKMVLDETALKIEICPKCGSTDYHISHHRKNKYGEYDEVLCKVCGRYYTVRPRYMQGSQYHHRIFNLVVHLSYFHLSSRTIREILLKYFRVKVKSHKTINDWINKFGNPHYKKMYKVVTEQIIEDSEAKSQDKSKKLFKKIRGKDVEQTKKAIQEKSY